NLFPCWKDPLRRADVQCSSRRSVRERLCLRPPFGPSRQEPGIEGVTGSDRVNDLHGENWPLHNTAAAHRCSPLGSPFDNHLLGAQAQELTSRLFPAGAPSHPAGLGLIGKKPVGGG